MRDSRYVKIISFSLWKGRNRFAYNQLCNYVERTPRKSFTLSSHFISLPFTWLKACSYSLIDDVEEEGDGLKDLNFLWDGDSKSSSSGPLLKISSTSFRNSSGSKPNLSFKYEWFAIFTFHSFRCVIRHFRAIKEFFSLSVHFPVVFVSFHRPINKSTSPP